MSYRTSPNAHGYHPRFGIALPRIDGKRRRFPAPDASKSKEYRVQGRDKLVTGCRPHLRRILCRLH
ncbi:hypothetical protein YPPY92_2970, partial [Yersinia pestis PY-92]